MQQRGLMTAPIQFEGYTQNEKMNICIPLLNPLSPQKSGRNHPNAARVSAIVPACRARLLRKIPKSLIACHYHVQKFSIAFVH